MGIFDFIKQGAQELFIARPDDDKDELVYKWPDPTIPMKAQVTVGHDEEAVFCVDGKPVGTLPAGRHTLDSANIPFLSPLLDRITQGNLFRAELWFVSIREMAGRRFGGNLLIEDPRSRQGAKLLVHGDYSLTIFNTAATIAFYGTQKFAAPEQFTGWFNQLLFKVLKDRIGEHLIKQKLGIFAVDSQIEEIEALVLEGVQRHMKPYGIRVDRLGNFTVTIDEKDAERIQARYTDLNEMEVATQHDLHAYQQFAAGKAMRGAADGMAKGGAGGGAAVQGAGLGVGFGMAQMFQQQTAQAPARAPAPPTAPVAPVAPAGATVACPKCQAQVSPGKFCGECGGALETRKPFCTECGKPKNPTAKFCSECGAQQAG